MNAEQADSELPHSCAFCQQFLIDCSEENGGLSAARRQMLDHFLSRAGSDGPDLSHPEEYKKDHSKLRTDLGNPNFILFDVAPRDLKSPAARDCILARNLDQVLSHIPNPRPPELRWQTCMFLAKLDVSTLESTARVNFLLYGPRPACPKRSRPGNPVPDYWTRPWVMNKYFAVAEEGACVPKRSMNYVLDAHVDVRLLTTGSCFVSYTGNAASSVISSRPFRSWGFPRQQTLDHGRSWLCTCIRGHDETWHAAPSSLYRPKRLLAISQGDTQNWSSTVVVITDDENTQRVPYACLSYKWGQGQEPVLTKKMLREGRGSLKFHTGDLPKTIADAVFVCQSLGIGYLWVDALCIIQDDAQDKAEQIGQMQHIYAQSTITIVASRADSSTDGFLHPRLEPSGRNEELGATCRLAYRSKKGEVGSVILHLRKHEGPLREPLHERGWTYQEFLLPPRIIDYGRMQTTYHCRECESRSTDGGIISTDVAMLLIRRRGFYELLKQHRTRGSSGGRVTNQIGVKWRSFKNIASWPLEDSWKLFVEESSRRQLSVPADRLSAMSAIANVFSKLTDEEDEYLAGHWRSGFPESLMWSRSWQKNEPVPGVEDHRAFGEYFAPSWSWPSVMGSVKFKYKYGKAGDVDIDFKVIDCRVQVTDPIAAPFASVLSGCLHVRAKTLRGYVSYLTEEDFGVLREREQYGIRIPLGSLPSPFNHDRVGTARYIPDGTSRAKVAEGTIENFSLPVLLVVLTMPSDSYPKTDGMVVEEVGNGLYRRVGWFEELDHVYRRAWPETKYAWGSPAPDGQQGRALDMKLVEETREIWYNIFEVRELKII